MPDLAARVFYKAHFDIVRERDNLDLLRDIIVEDLAKWLKHKYRSATKYWNWNQFSGYGNFDTDDHRLVAKTTSFFRDDSRYWACRIEEFEEAQEDEEDLVMTMKKAPRIWTTEVGFEQTCSDRATISYVCYYADKAGFIGITDTVPDRNIPGFIRNLIYCASRPFHCEIGNIRLSPVPIKLKPGNGDCFSSLVMDPERKVPLILVIPRSTQDNIHNPIAFPAKELAKNVMGNAIVYEADDSSMSEELSYLLDRQYLCLPGQIRIYWPESNKSTRRNRYLSVDEIDSIGNDAVIEIFRRVLSIDIRYYESKEMFRIDDCDEMYRQSRIHELRSQYQMARESIAMEKAVGKEIKEQFDIANELLLLADDEKAELQNHIRSLETDLSLAKQDLWKAKSHNDYLQSYQERARGIDASLASIRQCDKLPSSPLEVAQYYQRVFRDSLDFTDRGIRSLSKCVTKIDILWSCFFAMGTKLIELYRNNTPEIETVFLNATGWDMARCEGSQTRSNPSLMALRNDTYQGRSIFIEPHVKKGKTDNSPDCVRVYFAYDKVTDRIVIGHVGNHLDNHTTLSI